LANEIRVRANFISGTGFTCTNVATSITVTGLSALPTIDTTNYCTLQVESEIMWVTAHAAASNTVTVVRGREGTVAVAHTTAAWQHGPTAQDLNTPSVRCYNSAAQSVANATYAAITFDTNRFDTDTMHSTVTNTSRITFNTAGLYLVAFHVGYTAAADYVSARASIRPNGTGAEIIESWLGTQTDANDHYYVVVSTIYRFAVGDYVEAMVWQKNNAAAARNVVSVGNKSPEFMACRIGD
jgi:hypothetical protein